MKKSRISIGLMSCLLSVGALAGCNKYIKSSDDGILLTYTDDNGSEIKVYADDLLKDYYNDSTKYQQIFDAVYSVVVRNYFNHTEKVDGHELGKNQMDQIKIDAQYKVDSDIRTAEDNADANDTKYKDEIQKIYDEKGVEDEEGLFDYYVEQLQIEKFDENFYKYHMNDIKKGATDVTYKDSDGNTKDFWTGYFKDARPYHVSHILVKLEDSSESNYASGTISEANAKKLYDVVNALKTGNDSFGTIAYQYSEDNEGDSSSQAHYGDLGIMDLSTGYVNEFKLGIYAYENIVSEKAKASNNLAMGTDFVSKYNSAINDSYEYDKENYDSTNNIPTIPFKVFKDLNDVKDKVTDAAKKPVIENSSLVYPRNIIYNKYLNRHSVAFISGEGEAETTGSTGFHTYVATDGVPGLTDYAKPILSVKVEGKWQPILAVRAGSGYQGIHFIVINRGAFDDADYDVSLNDYYTTYYPEQDGYPTVSGKTYVNFFSNSTEDTKTRAEALETSLKGYNSDKLKKYIYKKYFALEGLEFTEENKGLEEALNKWIDRGIEKADSEADEKWEKTWNEYLDVLATQIGQRKKLVSEACRIGYDYANSSKKLNEIMIDYINEEGEPAQRTLYEEMKLFLDSEGMSGKVEEYLGTSTTPKAVSDLFKVKEGLCNDGKDHM